MGPIIKFRIEYPVKLGATTDQREPTSYTVKLGATTDQHEPTSHPVKLGATTDQHEPTSYPVKLGATTDQHEPTSYPLHRLSCSCLTSHVTEINTVVSQTERATLQAA
jgi:hypothetical protein